MASGSTTFLEWGGCKALTSSLSTRNNEGAWNPVRNTLIMGDPDQNNPVEMTEIKTKKITRCDNLNEVHDFESLDEIESI